MRDVAGRVRPCEVRLVRLPGGTAPLIRLSITDISERQRYQREIERLAYSDELTGLPNRRLLLDRLQHAMAREVREGRFGALLFIDLTTSRRSTTASATRWATRCCARSPRAWPAACAPKTPWRGWAATNSWCCSRLWANTPRRPPNTPPRWAPLLHSLHGSYRIGEHELSVSASIGIALHPFERQGAADVLKQADTAMYRAKQGGRNALHFFAPAMQAAIDQRLHLQRAAPGRGARAAVLEFQPQLALADERVVGAEALLRWRSPTRGWCRLPSSSPWRRRPG